MTQVDVGAIDEFPTGELRVLSVNGREIGVVRWCEEWYALRNVCPHLGAPVCAGIVRPLLTQDSVVAPDLRVDLTAPILMCPWHNWEFDLRSGRAVTGGERVKTYRVTVEQGRVKVTLDEHTNAKNRGRDSAQ